MKRLVIVTTAVAASLLLFWLPVLAETVDAAKVVSLSEEFSKVSNECLIHVKANENMSTDSCRKTAVLVKKVPAAYRMVGHTMTLTQREQAAIYLEASASNMEEVITIMEAKVE